ncbi:hypothetical protein PoB_001341700 [Plakobranchus ocellatus]|uniref:Uncharacterized protein n=1 Tax=Plakobranchus ocellatus TaxID=259542 RepID=A0AAV3YVC8_9GAST|nr:hypothetical protein PoB_001341700 [Plakobranchus ocellatus]
MHRELKSILGGETIEVIKLGSGDLKIELKSNDQQAKKLGAITTFLDIPVTVSPHKSLNISRGVRRMKARRVRTEFKPDTVFLTFDSPKPPGRIRAGSKVPGRTSHS